ERSNAEIDVLCRAGVAVVAPLPRAERRPDEVEPAVAHVVQVGEQRRDELIAAVLAATREVERSEPVITPARGDAVHERPHDGRAAVGRAEVPEEGKDDVVRVRRAAAVVPESAEQRRAVRLRGIREARLRPLEPERKQGAEAIVAAGLFIVEAVWLPL